MDRQVVFPTRHGPLQLNWTSTAAGPRIIRILLPCSSPSTNMPRPGSSPVIDAFGTNLGRWLDGENVELAIDLVELGQCSPFQALVLQAIRAIPRGSVSSYRLVAARLGKPLAPRAVGTALARNPFPFIFPCHRVVRSDGCLGGYRGGQKLKRALLEQEGVVLDRYGRVGGSGSIPYGGAISANTSPARYNDPVTTTRS